MNSNSGSDGGSGLVALALIFLIPGLGLLFAAVVGPICLFLTICRLFNKQQEATPTARPLPAQPLIGKNFHWVILGLILGVYLLMGLLYVVFTIRNNFANN